jgi:hypothetical protein
MATGPTVLCTGYHKAFVGSGGDDGNLSPDCFRADRMPPTVKEGHFETCVPQQTNPYSSFHHLENAALSSGTASMVRKNNLVKARVRLPSVWKRPMFRSDARTARNP